MRICEKFPKSRRPRKNFPDRDAYRTRKTIVLLPQRGGGKRAPRPAAGLGPPNARHTFCNSGKFRFFSDEAPNARHTFCNSGKFGPLLRRTHGKKIECVCVPGTLFVITKTSTLPQNFLGIDTRARHTFHKGPKKFHLQAPNFFTFIIVFNKKDLY